MRDRARSVAIGIALAPLTVLGLVAVFTHGTVEVVLAALGVALSSIAVAGIYFLERPQPRRSPPRAVRVEQPPLDASVGEHVVDLDLGVRWDLQSPDTWLVRRDGGAALILKPDDGDADRRLVVLVWAPCSALRVGPPGAGSRHEHRLYSRGLRECGGAAEVRDSSWIRNGERHFVVLTMKDTVEVAASNVVVHRVDRVHLAASAFDVRR